ncbi:MAG TPA: 50S ribosome-binding protein YggL [Gemmatimonadaceae bacterium]|nr:50S ribosome-binding protein YggL [Gemmatimonadaceae bacterium]
MSAPCPVFGFEARAETRPIDDEDRRELWRALEAEFLEPRGLTARSLAFGRVVSFAVTSEASQATDADRTALEAWARGRPEIIAFDIGPLLDFAAVA